MQTQERILAAATKLNAEDRAVIQSIVDLQVQRIAVTAKNLGQRLHVKEPWPLYRRVHRALGQLDDSASGHDVKQWIETVAEEFNEDFGIATNYIPERFIMRLRIDSIVYDMPKKRQVAAGCFLDGIWKWLDGRAEKPPVLNDLADELGISYSTFYEHLAEALCEIRCKLPSEVRRHLWGDDEDDDTGGGLSGLMGRFGT